MNLKHISENFVFKELNGFNISRSTGLDGVLARFLKDGAHVLKILIGFIVNLTIDYISCSYTHFG